MFLFWLTQVNTLAKLCFMSNVICECDQPDCGAAIVPVGKYLCCARCAAEIEAEHEPIEREGNGSTRGGLDYTPMMVRA